MTIRTRQKMPDILTLVDARGGWPTSTLMAEEGEDCHLLVSTTDGPRKITVYLNEVQARRLKGRIDKFLRDVR